MSSGEHRFVQRFVESSMTRRRWEVGLRTRLSLAFVFVVLVPVVVGAVLVAVVAPNVLHSQVSGRLRTARTSVTDVLAARCSQAEQAAQLLGLQVAAVGPAAAVQRVVAQSGVDYAVVEDDTGNAVAFAGSLRGAPAAIGAHPLPEVLGSCASGKNAAFAISAHAQLAIADRPSLREVAVAWSVDSGTSAAISSGLDGHPGITLLADGKVVSSTLTASAADKQAAALHYGVGRAASVVDVGSRITAFAPPTTGQPYGVVMSESRPNTTKLTWLLIAVVAATIAAGLAIGRLLARLISRPVMELSEAAGRVAEGDLDIAIPVRSRDEVGRLAGAFNHMTAELRTYIRQLEHSRDELRRNLDRLGATLTHTHDLGGILAVVLDTAIGSVQAGGGAILFLDSERNLVVKVTRGVAAEALPVDARVPFGKGIAGTVAKTGEPVRGVVGDGPGLRPDSSEPVAKTVIAVPLKQSGRTVGVLNLYDKQGDGPGDRRFSAHDLETILAFASQASVAVDNVLLHQEAQRLSLTDPLTGLWNYRYLTLGLGHEIERATRFGRPLAVLMLDLDRFKQVNDQYGHQMGDAVLIELASRMRTEVREVDTLARYGGEEFVVVLPETDAAGAARTADRLGQVIRSSPFCASSPHPLPVTTSIGVAVFPEHGANASRVLRSADNALYAAKNDGRDCWRFATLADDAGQGADDADARRSASGAGAETAPDEAALREAFDGASPLARTEQPDHDDAGPAISGGADSDPSERSDEMRPHVVVMPDVEVAGRADPRGQRGPAGPHA